MMIDDVARGPGMHAANGLYGLGINQDNVVDASFSQFRQGDEGECVPIDGKESAKIAVHRARQHGHGLRIEL